MRFYSILFISILAFVQKIKADNSGNIVISFNGGYPYDQLTEELEINICEKANGSNCCSGLLTIDFKKKGKSTLIKLSEICPNFSLDHIPWNEISPGKLNVAVKMNKDGWLFPYIKNFQFKTSEKEFFNCPIDKFIDEEAKLYLSCTMVKRDYDVIDKISIKKLVPDGEYLPLFYQLYFIKL